MGVRVSPFPFLLVRYVRLIFLIVECDLSQDIWKIFSDKILSRQAVLISLVLFLLFFHFFPSFSSCPSSPLSHLPPFLSCLMRSFYVPPRKIQQNDRIMQLSRRLHKPEIV